MMQLQNRFFKFEVDAEKGLFNLRSENISIPEIVAASLAITYSNPKKVTDILFPFNLIPTRKVVKSAAHGFMQQLQFEVHKPDSPLKIKIIFCLTEQYPLFLWRIYFKNISSQSVFIERIDLLKVGKIAGQGGLHFNSGKKAALAFYSNGWQSWSYSAVYSSTEKMKRSHFGPLLLSQSTNLSTPLPCQAGHFTSDFFGVIGDRILRKGLIMGFLSQKQQFGALEVKLNTTPDCILWAAGDHVRLKPDADMTTDWAVVAPCNIDDQDPLDQFLQAVAREHQLPYDFGKTPVGWCSWYQYYSNVTAQQIEENLAILKQIQASLPLTTFQIDDGWQSQVGDWLTFRKTFPHGVEPLARKIKRAGYQPGIWIAPFIVHPRSNLKKEHPDWLLRNASGRLVYAGFVWNTFTCALDLTNPHALEFAVKAVNTASKKWNFSYIKLDFLYAAALPGRYQDETKTRAQVLQAGLKALKKAAGRNARLVGCGLPLGSGLGMVSAMRIGTDVLENWHPKWFGLESIFRGDPWMPAAKNSIQNILSRSFLHRKWWINDPDCLLVRPTSQLTLVEVQSLATAIGMTGGSVILSDDLSLLPPERIKLVASLLPPIGLRPSVLDWFDQHTPSRLRLDLQGPIGQWQLLAFFNWTESPQKISLNVKDFRLLPARYWVRSFWTNEIVQSGKSQQIFIGELPAHAVVLLAVRPIAEKAPQYLGSDLHISQGMEVRQWRAGKTSLLFSLDLNRECEGFVDLYLPKSPQTVVSDQHPLEWDSLRKNIYRLKVKFTNSTNIQVKY